MCSTAVRRPFCLCKQNRADNPLPRHTHIPKEGTTFLFIHRGALFAFKTAQTRPIAPEFCPFFLWLLHGIKQVERSALSLTCHEAEHPLVPALKKLTIVSNGLCRRNDKAQHVLILTAPHCLQWCRLLVMELKLSLQLLQACFSLSRLDLEDFLQESLWNEEHNYVIKRKKIHKRDHKTIHGVLLTKILFGFHTILEKNARQLCPWPPAGWLFLLWHYVIADCSSQFFKSPLPTCALTVTERPHVPGWWGGTGNAGSQEELSFQHLPFPPCCNVTQWR